MIQSVLQGGNCAAVTAVANANYHFANWTGDVASAANSLTVTNT